MSKATQEPSVKKPASRTFSKRLLLMRRRIKSLLEEKESLEAKNQDLVNSINQEKKLTSELRQQVFSWQRMYHEAVISLNSYKVKHADMMQNVSSCLKDMNIALPHLVGLTNIMCQNKTNLTSQLNHLRSLDTQNYLAKSCTGSGLVDDSTLEKENQTIQHKVGPMVKGFPVQKPIILLERVTPQPQNQDAVNSDLSPTEANNLTPITEENEQDMSIQMGQISMRRRKHGLGSAERWRMRKLKQLDKDWLTQQEGEKENRCNSVADDSGTPLVPVIQLHGVSGLLWSPHLIELERGQASEGNGSTTKQSASDAHSQRKRTNSNPLEGSSWMNVNLGQTSGKKDPQKVISSPTVTTDSSDGENDVSNVPSNLRCSLYSNYVATAKRKSISQTISANTSKEASRLEPDSTSNASNQDSSHTRDSLGTITNNVSAVSCESLYSDTLQQIGRLSGSREKQKWCVVNVSQTMPGSCTVLATEKSFKSSLDRKRSNSFSIDCTTTAGPDGSGKRIRKPKIHTYPGEEEDFSVKADAHKTENVQSVTVKNKIPAINLTSSGGKKSLRKSSLKKSLEGARKSSVTTSATADFRLSQGKLGSSLQKLKTSKKSSMKNKSLETPRNSAVYMDQSSSQGEGSTRGSRRVKGPVSYKESPLNVKMRRPT